MEADMNESRASRRNYYWVCAILAMGRIYVDGAYNTETEAYNAARSKRELQGCYEIKEYPTINLQTANGFYKHEVAARTDSLELVAQRVKHQI